MGESSDDDCIDDLIKKNNPSVRRLIQSIAAARVAETQVCSPWQEEMDLMMAADERKYCTTVLLLLYL